MYFKYLLTQKIIDLFNECITIFDELNIILYWYKINEVQAPL